MTIIAAIASSNGHIWMAGDSAAISGYHLDTRADEKVFLNEDILFGFSTSFRFGQLLKWRLKVPDCPKDVSNIEYIQCYLLDAIRKTLKDGGCLKQSEGYKEEGGSLLVGYRGELLEIMSDFQVAQSRYRFYAIGCGFELALGAMAVLNKYDIPDQDIITKAVFAAEQFCSGVRRPFVLLDNQGNKEILS
jgi:ATP-dependent protease HslVU (ClpYQ) peptidase subunit